MSAIAASVIFTTYNQPRWLEHVLTGFSGQDRTDFRSHRGGRRVGFTHLALHCIAVLAAHLLFRVRHLWQADQGFRKCRILNAAIAASQPDHLVFTDGDCVPRRDFVSNHPRLRCPAHFLSGSYYKLSSVLSHAIAADDIASGRCFELDWLRTHGLPRRPRNAKLSARGWAADLLDRCIPTRASWNGHNVSAWQSDLLACNGFDERMGYGGEDREPGERLGNLGVTGMRMRNRAIVLHLDHARGYMCDDVIACNNAVRDETRRHRTVRTPAGLAEAFAHPTDLIRANH